MKFNFTSKSETLAKKFQDSIKKDRNLESSIFEKDGIFTIEYSIAGMMDEEEKKKDCSSETQEFATKEGVMNMVSMLVSEMDYQRNWLLNEIDSIAKAFYMHLDGHLPAIKGAEKMQNAINTLGIGGDYEIRKSTIWASRKDSQVIDVSL